MLYLLPQPPENLLVHGLEIIFEMTLLVHKTFIVVGEIYLTTLENKLSQYLCQQASTNLSIVNCNF